MEWSIRVNTPTGLSGVRLDAEERGARARDIDGSG
jgi:hypothetical protein